MNAVVDMCDYRTEAKAGKAAIHAFLANRNITAKLGNEKACCSVASINLALKGRLDDEQPDMMSDVIYAWIRPIQDAMPDALRNAPAWRNAIANAAYTRDSLDGDRYQVLKQWIWDDVMPLLRPLTQHATFHGKPLSESWDALCGGARRHANLWPPFESDAGTATQDDFAQGGCMSSFWLLRDAASRAGDPIAFNPERCGHLVRSIGGFVLASVRDYADAYWQQYAAAEYLAWVKLDPAACLKRLVAP